MMIKKTFLINVLSSLISFLQKVKEKVSLTNYEPNNFENLTPRNDIEDKIYFNAIKWALSNKHIKNIALTGPYGSGKSSILRTYEKNDKDHTYLKISLASFKKDTDEFPSNNKQSVNNVYDSIERSILQQMIYRVKKDTVPYSRFKRIDSLSKIKIGIKLVLFFIWGGFGLLIFKPSIINNVINNIGVPPIN